MSTLKAILEAFSNEEVLNPGEVVVMTKLPRYEVLASFHILEELDMIEVVYSKGSHKAYRMTERGKEVLEALKENLPINITVVREGIKA